LCALAALAQFRAASGRGCVDLDVEQKPERLLSRPHDRARHHAAPFDKLTRCLDLRTHKALSKGARVSARLPGRSAFARSLWRMNLEPSTPPGTDAKDRSAGAVRAEVPHSPGACRSPRPSIRHAQFGPGSSCTQWQATPSVPVDCRQISGDLNPITRTSVVRRRTCHRDHLDLPDPGEAQGGI
jgi:hypothetical protein